METYSGDDHGGSGGLGGFEEPAGRVSVVPQVHLSTRPVSSAHARRQRFGVKSTTAALAYTCVAVHAVPAALPA